jgi:hypothetical protein
MKLTLSAIAVICTALIAVPAQAARADIFLYGGGNETCGVWKVLREQQASAPQESWLFGYLTAVVSLKIPTNPDLGTIDIANEVGHADGVIAMMNSFCATHPDSTIYAAADYVSGQLVQKWFKSHPPLRPSR